MSYEVKIHDRIARVELLSRQGDQLLVAVDGKEYALDFVQLNKGSYSILYRNKSYNVELIPVNGVRKYHVNTFKNTYEVEIIDAEAKYLASRQKQQETGGAEVITAPIPGKVVKVMVAEGERVEAGQTLLILSAMKMESEFKSAAPAVVKQLKVSEGQSVEAREEMVVLGYEAKERRNDGTMERWN